MSSRHKGKAHPRPPDGGDPAQEVRRLIEKGRLKDAVKQAKILHRDRPTEESRRLLERAYLLRAQQLLKNGMPESSREVAGHLIDFGATDPSQTEDVARLLVELGMSRDASAFRDRLESPEARARLEAAAADQAVLHPERTAADPALRQGAAATRSALAALGDGGDESAALAGLRDVPRSSPFGDWKVFARGLAAYYRRDPDAMRANWDRLAPGRAAARIAQTLRALADPSAGGDLAAGPGLAALEHAALGGPVLADLQQLRDHAANDRWPEALRLLGGLGVRLRRIDPALPGRVTRALYDPFVKASTQHSYREAMDLIRSFTRAAEPLPIDPRWNRLWARIWEGPQGSLDTAEDYWRAYLGDLESLPSLSADERRLARALVWKHLAGLAIEEAEPEDLPPFLPPFVASGPPDHEVKRLRKEAVERLKKSIELAPEHRPSYELLYKTLKRWGRDKEAEAAARRLLGAFPEDLEAILFLADQHLRRDEPFEAAEFVQRARALKPLDREVIGREWWVLVASARHHARKRRWDPARAALEAAEQLRPEVAGTFPFLARKAALELRAGREDLAAPLIERAKGLLVEPGPLWLALLIEATRYNLAKPLKDRFAAEWQSAQKLKARGETAGALAALLAPFLADDVKYTGRATHLKQVVAYIKRTSKVKYRHEDLRRVCELLGLMPAWRERSLLNQMVERGLRSFPDSPFFLFMGGAVEFAMSPFLVDPDRARKRLEKALERAQGSPDPEDAALVPRIKQALTTIAEFAAGPRGMPFGGPGGAMDPLDFFTLFDEVGIDPDDAFGDDDGPDFDDAPRAPAPRRGRPRRKR
jgi:tetratricopeptide (TPR) repeat protein